MEQTVVVTEQPPRNRVTGQVILAVLLFTFPLLALLVMEQGRVIDAQRLLIQQLSSDSYQLSAMRMRELQNRSKQAAPSAKTPQADKQKPSTQPNSGAAPQPKTRKRHESQQAPPPPPQEYPASRPVPVRKAV